MPDARSESLRGEGAMTAPSNLCKVYRWCEHAYNMLDFQASFPGDKSSSSLLDPLKIKGADFVSTSLSYGRRHYLRIRIISTCTEHHDQH